jgi:hypothetical protein
MKFAMFRFSQRQTAVAVWPGATLLARLAAIGLLVLASSIAHAEEAAKACIDGTGLGWKAWGQDDFQMVNGDDSTWTWKDDGVHCSGQPVGVTRSKKQLTNFELVVEWRHLSSGGNSGVFCWVPESAFANLAKGSLPPTGIEVQVLDHGFTTQYEERSGKKADWFTTNGDVFPVAGSKMTPFEPKAPDGRRSFPRQNRSKGINEWNHYYVRAINGEIRLWVNGEEVSGGNNCEPRSGFLCLESEGAPVDFRRLRIRELP